MAALATIGYEGRTLDEYLAELGAARVTVLCDLRRTPLSHKPGFSKGKLAAACAAAGIRYEHLPQLGIASERRKRVKTPADKQRMFREYARALPHQRAAIDQIAAWVRAKERVALTCFERDVHDCHRQYVAAALARRLRTAPLHL